MVPKTTPVTNRPTAPRGKHSRELRIIAGLWRGRRWRFPDLGAAREGLRPTPDRVRETLFNWLQPKIAGARCLDLFAGSGALGLEAVSRGAASAVFVESDKRTATAISELAEQWGANAVTVEQCRAADFLARKPVAFNLVFLDPPFAAGLLEATAAALMRGWLATGALIYVERAGVEAQPTLPTTWQLLKQGSAGAVSYHLYHHNA